MLDSDVPETHTLTNEFLFGAWEVITLRFAGMTVGFVFFSRPHVLGLKRVLGLKHDFSNSDETNFPAPR